MPIPWQDWSAYGLVALCVALVLFGVLIPRWLYVDLRKERDELRKSNADKDATIAVLVNTNRTLSEVGRVTGAVLNALPVAGSGGSNGQS